MRSTKGVSRQHHSPWGSAVEGVGQRVMVRLCSPAYWLCMALRAAGDLSSPRRPPRRAPQSTRFRAKAKNTRPAHAARFVSISAQPSCLAPSLVRVGANHSRPAHAACPVSSKDWGLRVVLDELCRRLLAALAVTLC